MSLFNPTIAFEVSGPAAMFTRPDTGATPISYPVPTYSAAKGMFDAVLRWGNIYVRPTHVEICKPIRYERYVTNYGGPLRNAEQISGRNNYQLIATILVDVCYRIFAEVKEKNRSGQRKVDYGEEFKRKFDMRLATGQTFYTPSLGWKEFVPTYLGPVRIVDENGKTIERAKTGEIQIASLLCSMWERHCLKPTFCQDWWIIDGLMSYEYPKPREL